MRAVDEPGRNLAGPVPVAQRRPGHAGVGGRPLERHPVRPVHPQAELELEFPEAREPGDENWDALSGWQQGVRYYWDEQTTHAQVLAEFREMRAAGQDESAPRYVAIVAELGDETAEALWDKAAPADRTDGFRGTAFVRGAGGYTQAVRTPRDLDPQGGSTWDLPSDAETETTEA